MEDGALSFGSGRAVHGLWFDLWRHVSPEFAGQLHRGEDVSPFTLTPLMDLPRPRQGHTLIQKDTQTWFRVATLNEALSTSLTAQWLPALPEVVELGGVQWGVLGHTCSSDEHPWAGQIRYSEVASQQLFQNHPPKSWRMRFQTPTTFHGGAGHLPFPLPDSLVKSWMRRWQAFAPIALPEELPQQVREGVVVSAYKLKTVPVRYGKRLTVGSVGWVKLYAVDLHPAMRAGLNLLAYYAFYCGSGAKTTQGMGMTRVE